MRAVLRISGLAALLAVLLLGPAAAQQQSFTSNEIVGAGHRFFGGVSRGLATVIERAVSQWGLPNGYILGQEGGGAVFAGARYGEGTLYTKNAGDLRVYWQGPSLGWDVGGEGARTMMLIYNLPATEAVYQRFAGVDGSAYVVGGFGMTVLTSNRIVLVPVRDILFLRAEQKYVTVRTRSREHLIEESLIALEREFTGTELPYPFVRIHRNCLVARSVIRGFERTGGGDEEAHWQVVLDGIAERLPVSRRQWPAVRELVADK